MQSQFNRFKLSPAVLRGLETLGFTTPTPVQEHAIPLVLEGRDAIVQAKTGSGKTLAFGLPLLTMLKSQPQPRSKPQALVVLPTRELAIQVCEAIANVAPGTNSLRTLAIYGGVGLGPQETALNRGVDMVVGTPGRLKDLIQRGSLDLSKITVLVLDEADEMLDMGFRRDIDFLLDRMPGRQQTLVFSATMPEAIEVIARKHMKDPAVVKLTNASEVSPSEISHYFARVHEDQRFDALVHLIESEKPECGIIFTRMKHETKKLSAKLMAQAGIEAGFLNGNMSQNARNTMMARYRAGEFKFLVATDVAARGLDIEGLTHVFHFAVPTVVETYIHRSGRTGRAGNEGKTIIFVTPDAEADFRAIQKKIKLEELKLDLGPVKPRTPEQIAAAAADRDRFERGNGRGRRQAPAPRRDAQAPRHEGPRDSRQAAPQGQRDNRSVQAPRDARSLAPQSWRKFTLPLSPGHQQTQESLQRWLSQETRVARQSMRGFRIFQDHATFEVETQVSESFVQRIKAVSRA